MTVAQILKIGEMKIVNKHLLNLSKFNDEGQRLYAIKTLGITLVLLLPAPEGQGCTKSKIKDIPGTVSLSA